MAHVTYFATAIPGIGQILAREIAGLEDAAVQKGIGFDGRNDVVSFSVGASSDILRLRTAEDVFVVVSSSPVLRQLTSVVERLLDEQALNRALSVFATKVRPLKTRMSFRVVARLLSEDGFLRTQLRDEITKRAQELRPRWLLADPSDLELWALETKPRVVRLGLRLSSPSMRSRGGRSEERPGSLRPTVAAAMLSLLESGVSGRLLDPCCGSGTVLMEAQSIGLEPIGSDTDTSAVRAARRNVQRMSSLMVADARHVPLRDNAVDCVVSNLPFGKRYHLQGRPRSWYDEVLSEIARVSVPGASIVLLTSKAESFERCLRRQRTLVIAERLELRLLGTPALLWSLRRR